MSLEWRDQHESILKEWKAKCFINMWLQTTSAYHYAKLQDYMSYPVIILSSVSSATLFSTNSKAVQYTVGVVTMLTGVITALSRQLKPGELYQQYSQTTKRYKALIRNIDTCLDLPLNMRPKPEVFIEKIGADMDSLSSSQLYPPVSVLKKFESKFGHIDVMMYGEDIIELLTKDLNISKLFKALKKRKTPS